MNTGGHTSILQILPHTPSKSATTKSVHSPCHWSTHFAPDMLINSQTVHVQAEHTTTYASTASLTTIRPDTDCASPCCEIQPELTHTPPSPGTSCNSNTPTTLCLPLPSCLRCQELATGVSPPSSSTQETPLMVSPRLQDRAQTQSDPSLATSIPAVLTSASVVPLACHSAAYIHTAPSLFGFQGGEMHERSTHSLLYACDPLQAQNPIASAPIPAWLQSSPVQWTQPTFPETNRTFKRSPVVSPAPTHRHPSDGPTWIRLTPGLFKLDHNTLASSGDCKSIVLDQSAASASGKGSVCRSPQGQMNTGDPQGQLTVDWSMVGMAYQGCIHELDGCGLAGLNPHSIIGGHARGRSA